MAEKLEAMVQLGIGNSRMKDFFDLDFLARTFEFDGAVLTEAIRMTFERRRTAVPDGDPVAFTTTFTEDAQKNAQWTGFLRRSGMGDVALTLRRVVANIRDFVGGPLRAVGSRTAFRKVWSGGGWR